MRTFTLPAGSRMRCTATSGAASRHVHKWGLDFSTRDSTAGPAPGQQAYGSEIGKGENQRIEIPAQALDRVCRVWATHQTAGGWETDVDHLTLDTPDNLSIDFQRPRAGKASDEGSECVMAFTFTPALGA